MRGYQRLARHSLQQRWIGATYTVAMEVQVGVILKRSYFGIVEYGPPETYTLVIFKAVPYELAEAVAGIA